MGRSHPDPAGGEDSAIHGGPIAGTAVSVDPREAQAHRTLLQDGVTAVARALTGIQGQYLAYIHYYTVVHRRPPSENEIANFLWVRGPSAHRMIIHLEEHGYLSRIPGQPRTLKVMLSRESIPDLEPSSVSTNAT